MYRNIYYYEVIKKMTGTKITADYKWYILILFRRVKTSEENDSSCSRTAGKK